MPPLVAIADTADCAYEFVAVEAAPTTLAAVTIHLHAFPALPATFATLVHVIAVCDVVTLHEDAVYSLPAAPYATTNVVPTPPKFVPVNTTLPALPPAVGIDPDIAVTAGTVYEFVPVEPEPTTPPAVTVHLHAFPALPSTFATLVHAIVVCAVVTLHEDAVYSLPAVPYVTTSVVPTTPKFAPVSTTLPALPPAVGIDPLTPLTAGAVYEFVALDTEPTTLAAVTLHLHPALPTPPTFTTLVHVTVVCALVTLQFAAVYSLPLEPYVAVTVVPTTPKFAPVNTMFPALPPAVGIAPPLEAIDDTAACAYEFVAVEAAPTTLADFTLHLHALPAFPATFATLVHVIVVCGVVTLHDDAVYSLPDAPYVTTNVVPTTPKSVPVNTTLPALPAAVGMDPTIADTDGTAYEFVAVEAEPAIPPAVTVHLHAFPALPATFATLVHVIVVCAVETLHDDAVYSLPAAPYATTNVVPTTPKFVPVSTTLPALPPAVGIDPLTSLTTGAAYEFVALDAVETTFAAVTLHTHPVSVTPPIFATLVQVTVACALVTLQDAAVYSLPLEP